MSGGLLCFNLLIVQNNLYNSGSVWDVELHCNSIIQWSGCYYVSLWGSLMWLQSKQWPCWQQAIAKEDQYFNWSFKDRSHHHRYPDIFTFISSFSHLNLKSSRPDERDTWRQISLAFIHIFFTVPLIWFPLLFAYILCEDWKWRQAIDFYHPLTTRFTSYLQPLSLIEMALIFKKWSFQHKFIRYLLAVMKWNKAKACFSVFFA